MSWWKDTVFYQIYISSFMDGNNDGIGDFKGITQKLEYLTLLGVKGIWLTPFYVSPKVDQGYDIADYYHIDPQYGTMSDFDLFIEKAQSLDIKVIIDIVINHTSTQHEWFIKSKTNKEYQDLYVWKEEVPNNWESFFGGSAWEHSETNNSYYYHSFAKEQADLNFNNPTVYELIKNMLKYWIDKGVDGFRLDVINNLTVSDEFRNNPIIEGKQLHEQDVNQQGILNIIKQLCKDLRQYSPGIFLVGEISSDNLELIRMYTGPDLLDTTFNFNLGSQRTFNIDTIYDELEKMNIDYDENNLPTIFFSSHDMARSRSRFELTEEQVKSLFTLLLTYRAIPFIYNGEEIGMNDYIIKSLTDARDIQGINHYHLALENGFNKTEALIELANKSRDYSRNTMYWSDNDFGGFSQKTPWISYQKQSILSVEEQISNKESVWHYVSSLIHLRNDNKVLQVGSNLLNRYGDLIILEREHMNNKIIILINLCENNALIDDKFVMNDYMVILKTSEDSLYCYEGQWHIKAHASCVMEEKYK